jgi:iron complex transport system substrate-binding protein
MKSQMEAMDIIGKALGRSDQADKYRKNYEDAIALVSERVKDIPVSKLPRIYHSVNEAVRTDGPGTLGADWISVTRAINVSVDQPLKYAESNYYSTLEQIYSWNPQIIICNESGVSDYILTDQKWEGLDAVADKKVYQMPIGASRWGHQGSAETALGLLWLAKQLYPDQFKDIDLYEKTKEFYDTFYHYAVTPETMRLILSGKGLRDSVSNPSDI